VAKWQLQRFDKLGPQRKQGDRKAEREHGSYTSAISEQCRAGLHFRSSGGCLGPGQMQTQAVDSSGAPQQGPQSRWVTQPGR